MSKKFKILDRNADCVLVYNTDTHVYKVIDIENDLICMTKDYEQAERVFNTYSIEVVRKEKRKLLEDWIKANAEA